MEQKKKKKKKGDSKKEKVEKKSKFNPAPKIVIDLKNTR